MYAPNKFPSRYRSLHFIALTAAGFLLAVDWPCWAERENPISLGRSAGLFEDFSANCCHPRRREDTALTNTLLRPLPHWYPREISSRAESAGQSNRGDHGRAAYARRGQPTQRLLGSGGLPRGRLYRS